MSSKKIIVSLLLSLISVPAFAAHNNKLAQRSGEAADTLKQLVDSPDRSAPLSLLKKSTCIMVVPSVVKAGYIFGARYGRGLASCRNANGSWNAPSFVEVGGGSFGFQIGINATDMVLVFTRENALNVVASDNFTLGGNASMAAGPVGRNLEGGTDYKLDSEIYTYARSRGIFAGVSFEGTVVNVDQHANAAVYGNLTAKQILNRSGLDLPAEVRSFVAALNEVVPK